jgi:hypothetical protein
MSKLIAKQLAKHHPCVRKNVQQRKPPSVLCLPNKTPEENNAETTRPRRTPPPPRSRTAKYGGKAMPLHIAPNEQLVYSEQIKAITGIEFDWVHVIYYPSGDSAICLPQRQRTSKRTLPSSGGTFLQLPEDTRALEVSPRLNTSKEITKAPCPGT